MNGLLENRSILLSYFIDSAASNSNRGLTSEPRGPASRKVNQTSFASGDTILFSAGRSLGGTVLFGPDDAGSASARIRVGSFGDGRATLVAGSGGDGRSVVNTSGIEVSGLNILGSGTQPNESFNGIEFETNLPGT